MSANLLQQIFERIKSEREELREDLMGLPLNPSKYRVGDFGCGWGYITWCLAREIPNSECVGIDKFDPCDPPSLGNWRFSIEDVRNLHKVIDAEHPLDFQQGDLVNDENLPSDFDFIYCKRVLFNIFRNDNPKSGGNLGIKLAINHIANALKPDGWFCLVEIEALQTSSDIESFLKQAGFEFSKPRKVGRPYNTPLEIFNEYQYSIYQCKKSK